MGGVRFVGNTPDRRRFFVCLEVAMFNNAFVNARWSMKQLRLGWLVILINIVLYTLFRPFVIERPYSNPANVRFLSSIHVPILGCVAFRKLNGKLLFRW